MAQLPIATAVPNPNPAGTFKPITSSTTIGAVPAAAAPIQPPMSNPSGPPQMMSPTKEVNVASLCRHGQEMVQDVVQKTTEIFQWLKQFYLPNGTTITPAMCQERRLKLEEHIKNVNSSFQRLLFIYNMVKDYKAEKPIEEYLPIEVNGEIQGEKPRINENVLIISDEHKELVEQIQLKNQHLKEVIDHLRMMIWEINTMMAVKRT